MNSSHDQVISQLRPTDICTIISFFEDRTPCVLDTSLDVKYKTSTEKKVPGVVAVVVNGLTDSVILFKKSKENITIAGTYPIYEDFDLSIRKIAHKENKKDEQPVSSETGHVVEIRSKIKYLMFIIKNDKAVQTMEYEINKYLQIAKKNNWRADGKSHQWVKLYKIHKLDERLALESRRNSLAGLKLSQDNPFLKKAQLESTMEASVEPDSDQIKEDYILNKMQERESEFTLVDNIKLFIGTWNVNGRPSKESLIPWFQSSKELVNADIIAIGFQEMDLSPEAYLLNDGTKEEEWDNSVRQVLALMKDSYTKLRSKQLVGMLLMIYVKEQHVKDIEYVADNSAGCGIMGMMGNKGGVAIRIKFRDTYLCFVNCHLAASVSEVSRRNQDYKELCRRLVFPSHIGVSRYFATAPGVAGATGLSNTISNVHTRGLSVYNNDILFWLGDLNYRIDLPEEKVFALLNENKLGELIEKDQLNAQKKLNLAFSGFSEGELNFLPTYKYEIGSEVLTPNEKKRIPSWCDRILWCANKEENVKQLFYQSQNSMVSSDHKPVSALFNVSVKTLLTGKYEEVRGEISRVLDKFENEVTAVVSVSPLSIDFGEVKYNCYESRTITIENTSPTCAHFEILPTGDIMKAARPWLWVNPPKDMLLPGESKQYNVTILVDESSAPALNMGQEELKTIIKITLRNEKAYFVDVFGEYKPTCFGTALGYLAKLTGPIREANPKEIQSLPAHFERSIPWEIWRMCDFLSRYGATTEKLFLEKGDDDLVTYIRECLDTGEEEQWHLFNG
ncbi:DNase I-like protein [Basidiobolus meristosporus CBS 931.73]|uniref:DNase I-like protein n=1 Tax=Basidiobolus meristosporus CBS 931.73 TaxID=1314790 RepID=A0A1Y1XYG8_9FUNG|nr:DNase I-like protein [Basidiobolus meristosporus CBS 931.73]|eukprot:ORX90705.1 DNase I-like protein [Basidiobolus meristosporus CBS 931.73]